MRWVILSPFYVTQRRCHLLRVKEVELGREPSRLAPETMLLSHLSLDQKAKATGATSKKAAEAQQSGPRWHLSRIQVMWAWG